MSSNPQLTNTHQETKPCVPVCIIFILNSLRDQNKCLPKHSMLKTACQKSLDGLILRILNDLYCQKPTVLQFRTTNMNKLNYKHGRCNKSHFYDVLVFPKAIVFSSTHSKVSTSLHFQGIENWDAAQIQGQSLAGLVNPCWWML